MSELSTVAIKDGHRGHPHSHHAYDQQEPMTNVDTERADRISRLPGLERLTQTRQTSNASIPPGGSASHPQGYFESPIPPGAHAKERSTVGSASATGSVGGRTTWASGSEPTDATDKMSTSEDMETGSDGGASDENASLVGFGEGASSTMSGPVSSATPGATRASLRQRMSGMSKFTHGDQGKDPRYIDGMSVDKGDEMMDSTPPAITTDDPMLERLDANDVSMSDPKEMQDGRKELGDFSFEGKK